MNLNLNQQLVSDYVQKHRDQSKIIYAQLNEKLMQTKEHIISKANKNREPNLELTEQSKVFIKRFDRGKSKNKFEPQTITQINDTTIETDKNKKVHKSNIKRPPKQN